MLVQNPYFGKSLDPRGGRFFQYIPPFGSVLSSIALFGKKQLARAEEALCITVVINYWWWNIGTVTFLWNNPPLIRCKTVLSVSLKHAETQPGGADQVHIMEGHQEGGNDQVSGRRTSGQVAAEFKHLLPPPGSATWLLCSLKCGGTK